jgi:hypothetical protein
MVFEIIFVAWSFLSCLSQVHHVNHTQQEKVDKSHMHTKWRHPALPNCKFDCILSLLRQALRARHVALVERRTFAYFDDPLNLAVLFQQVLLGNNLHNTFSLNLNDQAQVLDTTIAFFCHSTKKRMTPTTRTQAWLAVTFIVRGLLITNPTLHGLKVSEDTILSKDGSMPNFQVIYTQCICMCARTRAHLFLQNCLKCEDCCTP